MNGRMPALSGDLGAKPIHEVLRSLNAGGGTGTLELSVGGQKRRLHFQDGELYLAAGHPLAKRLGELVAELRGTASVEVRNRCLELVQRMAGVVAEWRAGPYSFDADPASLPADRVGPLPTERLVMVASTVDLDEAALLARLGGLGGQVTARSSSRRPDALGIAPEELYLIERLSQPMTVEAILAESPVPRLDLLRAMEQLRTVGRLRALGKDGSGSRVAPVPVSAEAEFAARLSQRFERTLKEEPLGISAEEYRQRLTDLVGKFGGLNAYEILGVEPSTPGDTVQARYEDLARLVHPSNEAAYGLAGLKPMLEMLFDRATQAYFSLSDPERRRLYNEVHAIDLGSVGVTGARREEEQRELARRYFDQALTMSARGEFHFALEMLELATKTDRKVEYFLALARIQAKNPKWSGRAIGSCRAALEIDSHNAEARYQLGELYEAGGDLPRARAQYQAAVRENPQHVQAAAKLRALEIAGAESRPAGGLFDRLFGRRG
jgi:tetratricopeptide (TPR) repeat protein